MVDEALLFLSAVWPTILSICVVLASPLIWWRSVTGRPGTRRQRPKRPETAVGEPMQKGELPAWRGIRH
jgi:hypothetical protein